MKLRNMIQGLLRHSNKKPRHIVYRSNVIQFDEMGYPLRYVIMSDHEHVWLDTIEQEGDVVLKWEEA
ncbi:hypothetical protein LGV83_11515 [Enterococcus durans]|uniref:hypothetical protein n=1 Tax=Enterococcus TaxID=1350 RepID=UPI00104059EF|nr:MULTISPECIES: hypothetical protein [Enterococcus]EJC3722828.1 hypothetical protein [Enterococcus faecium]MCG3448633.1 hypothetical protein [Enterococcus durans]TBX33713.1 hypothetical protein EUZ95_04675 [Enterococcus durans]HAQ6896767.1 hypothetical protein [Enterococcus faecium]HAQ6929161.1 hypothetical protein [Enterococcus faecium]